MGYSRRARRMKMKKFQSPTSPKNPPNAPIKMIQKRQLSNSGLAHVLNLTRMMKQLMDELFCQEDLSCLFVKNITTK